MALDRDDLMRGLLLRFEKEAAAQAAAERLAPFVTFASFAVLGVWVLVCIWVYEDAKKRGYSAGAWALVTFLFVIFGLSFYILRRLWDPEEVKDG